MGSQWIKIEISQEMNNDPLSTAATHFAEGNIYNSSAGLGNISNAWLFSTTMNFGTRLQGILSAPLLVQDASLNSNTYTALLETIDEQGHIRNCIYDIGATGNVKYSAIISVQNGKMINFNIYPNPVTSTLVISNLATNTLVKIVNSLGQTVLQQRTTAQSFTLDVSELTKGIYFIQVNGENGKIGSRMFTKE